MLPLPLERLGAISSTSGAGFFASDSSVLIGSASGPGITWNGSNLEFRGTITAGTITDPVLLDQLKGDDGYTPVFGVDYFNGGDGYTPIFGVDYFNGSDGKSFNFRGLLSFESDLSLISNPERNDAYRIEETDDLWVYNGSSWDNMGPLKGADADYVTVSGPRSFKYYEDNSGTFVPEETSITLNASLNGALTLYLWQYWNGTTWSSLSGDITSSSYILQHDNPNFIDSSLRIRCLSGDKFDEYTIVKLYDGTDALVGYLTNETISISTNATGLLYDLTNVTGSFKVFKGDDLLTSNVSFSVTTATKDGLTLSIDNLTGVYSVDETSVGSWDFRYHNL